MRVTGTTIGLGPLEFGLALAVPASAQESPPAPGAARDSARFAGVIAAFDTNGDGVLTLDEWLAAGRKEDAFERVQGNGLAEEGRALYDSAKQFYVTDKPAMSLPYLFTADVTNDGREDVLAIGPTDPSWKVKSDPSAVRFWLNEGAFQFQETATTSGLAALDWTLIGATVEALEGETLLGSRQLTTARSYKSGGELTAHFGLGRRQLVDVRVKLRTGERVLKGVAADAIYILDLADGTAMRCCQEPVEPAAADRTVAPAR